MQGGVIQKWRKNLPNTQKNQRDENEKKESERMQGKVEGQKEGNTKSAFADDERRGRGEGIEKRGKKRKKPPVPQKKEKTHRALTSARS